MDIKEAREKAGMSRQDVCDLIGMSYRTIQDWELGNKHPADWVVKLVVAEIQRHKKSK